MIKANKIVFYALILIWVLAGSAIFNHTVMNAQPQNNQQDSIRYMRLFTEVFRFLNLTYADELDVDELIINAIEGMLEELDPHTSFFRPDDFRDFTSNTMGEFGGLGITIDRRGEYITVNQPIEGTPAYRVGIRSGDRIVEVDGENVVGMSTSDVISRMRGTPGTRVLIGISRPGVDDMINFDIIREIIRISSVPYAFRLDNGVGYIRIRSFNAQTTNDLRTAIDNLEAEGINGLLIDLRSNPGGLLTEAVDTVNEFIGPNRLVVSTRGRMREANRQYNTRFNRMRTGYPVVVLINEASASASEIFAGSLQDWDKGLVVGKTSFGKGSVQQLFPLADGYGIKITTSRYYIMSGRGIHKDINDRILRGEVFTDEERAEIYRQNQEKEYFTTNGRVVFGGGGIVPDIEIDQMLMTRLDREIRRLNLTLDFSLEFEANHPDRITLDFVPDEALIQEFLEFGTARGLTFTAEEREESLEFITLSLVRDIIDKKYGEAEAFRASLAFDRQLMDALDLFDRFQTLEQMLEYAATTRTRENQDTNNGETRSGGRRGRRG